MEKNITEIKWSWDHPIIQEILLKYYRDFLFNTPQTAQDMVARVLSLSHIQPPGQILDIGCGLGYHAATFAKKGFQVFAFDPGEKYLKLAENYFRKEGVEVSSKKMRCGDLKEFERFSLAWAGWYCAGQLTSSEVISDFKRIFRALTPGGWFVSKVAGPPKVEPSEKVRNWNQLSDCFVMSEKWVDEKHRYEDCWFVYPQTNKVLKITEVELMYRIEDYISFLLEAEFVDIITANDVMGEEPAKEGSYFAFWCRKPKA